MLGQHTVSDPEFEERFNRWNAKTLGIIKEDGSVLKRANTDPAKLTNCVVKGKKSRRQVKGILTQKLENNLSFLDISTCYQKTDENNAANVIPHEEISISGTSSHAESEDEFAPTFAFSATNTFLRPRVPISAQSLRDKWMSNLAFLEVNMKEEKRPRQRQTQNKTTKLGPGTLQSKLKQNLCYLDISNSNNTVDGCKQDDQQRHESTCSGSLRLSKYPGKGTDEPEDRNSGKQFSIKIDRPQGKKYAEELNRRLKTTPIKIEHDKHTDSHEIKTQKICKTNVEVENNSFQQPKSAVGNKVIETAVIPDLNKTVISLPSNQEIWGEVVKKKHQLDVDNMETISSRREIHLLNGSEKQIPNEQNLVFNHTSVKLKLAQPVTSKDLKASENIIKEETCVKNDLGVGEDTHAKNFATVNMKHQEHDEMMEHKDAKESQKLKTKRKPGLSSRMKQSRIQSVKLLKKSEKLSDYIGVRSPVKTRSSSLEKCNKRKKTHCKHGKSARKSSPSEGQSTKGSKQHKRKRRQRKITSKKLGQKDDKADEMQIPLPRNSVDKAPMTETEHVNVKLESDAMWIARDELLTAKQKLEESFEAKSDSETIAWNCDFEMNTDDKNGADQHTPDMIKIIPAEHNIVSNLETNVSNVEMNIKQAGSEFSEHNQQQISFVPVISIREQNHMYKVQNSLLNKLNSGMRLTETERAVLEVSETVNDYFWERQDTHHGQYTIQINIGQLEEESLWVMLHVLLSKLGASSDVYSRLLTISKKSSAEARVILQVFLDLLFYELSDSPAYCSVDIIKTVSEIAQQLRYRDEF